MVGGITVASGGRGAERIGDLLSLQGRAKRDPEGYEGELLLQLRHFDACLGIFLLQPTTSSSGNAASAASADPGASKELADMAMFLAHMTPLYPQHLGKFPQQLLQLLASHGATLQPALCRQLTQAVILLRNRKMISLVDALPVLMALQCRGDRVLRRLCFLHIVQDIRRMNLKNKNEPSNKPLQTILYNLLQDENDVKAKRALVVLAELNRRKVWVDERTANAICNACFHKVPRIMIAALRFLLGYDQAADDEVEEASSSDDEADMSKPTSTSALSREAVYKAYHKGTTSSRRKKQAKLQRVMRSLQRQQRSKSQALDRQSHAPLYHVHDPQTFAEKLFARLQGCTERFEVKLMMMMAISRAVGIHRLTLLNFYPYLQRYIQVPPDAVESMIRQLVNQFVHDRARPEVMAVGLNTVREICMRIPLIMTKELLTDLALYKKSREKAVSAAARSIIAVYRQVWPALLEKKDRGRGADLTAHPKAYGEAVVSTGIPGAELLLEEDVDSEEEGSDKEDEEGEEDNDEEGVDILSEDGEMGSDADLIDSDEDLEGSEDNSDNSDGDEESDDEEVEEMQDNGGLQKRKFESEDGEDLEEVSRKKQKTVGGVTEAGSTEQSLRNLKKIVAAKAEYKLESEILSRDGDGILSNEDFERIRELQAKKAARSAMAEHGMTKAGKNRREVTIKLGRNENLGEKRVNPAHLEARIHKRREKEERVASARAGREDRPQFGARTAIKQKKTGGTSNRQKEKSKGMPLAAKRAIVARTKQQRRIKGKSANKQFRGKKAWK
ncbi:hypothetical protein CY35_03G112000 [Sphagnum magellanicum]|nr:hypothetical protein CY35_03G112000 [Sphagnum magellanicum]